MKKNIPIEIKENIFYLLQAIKDHLVPHTGNNNFVKGLLHWSYKRTSLSVYSI